MAEKEKKYNLKSYIESAYKKLKSYSYYDNKNIFLKNRIVDFENNKKNNLETYTNFIENKFKSLEEFILNNKNIDFKFIHSWILKENDLQEQGTFTIRTVPKSIRSYDEEYYKIISNFEDNDSKAKVDKLMYYLDIDIMSQIIGTLWVMMIGKDLEEEYIDYVAGNLLEQDMDKNNLKLFKPYYLSYERWRDDAINIIENRLKNGNRSTMLSLDIKEYYYSINLDIEYYKKKIIKKYKIRKFLDNNISENDIEKLDEFKVFKYINDYVFNVIRAYSKAMNLRKINNERNGFRNILPIGFLPSSILSNLYLSDFDKSVNKILSPLYYKRYVDDILIVLNTDYKKQEKFKNEDILNKKFYENELFEIGVLVNNSLENNKTLSKINRKKEKDKTEIIVLNSIDNFMNFIKKIDRDDIELKKNILNILKKYIIRDKFENDEFKSWKKTNPIEKKCNIEEVEKNLKYINEKLIIKSSKFKKIYLLKEYIKNKESYLVIQDEKVRIYDFSSSGSKALIENFKKEIAKNSSVFKFLPQKDEVLNNFDSEVYKLEYKDSINKLSSISEFKINRYNLSKFLARIIYSDKLENADYINDVNEKISWIFEGKYAVEFFFLWNKVFNYYLMNNRYDLIKKIFCKIYKSIENLELELDEFTINIARFETTNKLKRKINLKLEDKSLFKLELLKLNLKIDLRSYLKFVLAMNYALDDNIFINDIKNSKISNKFNNNDIIKKLLGEMLGNKYEEIFNLDNLHDLKEYIRISNMLDHSLVKSPLMNYYYLSYKDCYPKELKTINVNFVNYIVSKPEILTNRSTCFFNNLNYENSIIKTKNNCKNNHICIKSKSCNMKIDSFTAKYNPRFVHMHECILNSIHSIIAEGKIINKGEEIKNAIKLFKILNTENKKYENENFHENYSNDVYSDINNILDSSKEHKLKQKFLETHFKYFDFDDYLFVAKERVINYLEYAKYEKKDKLKIGIINMKINNEDLESSFKKVPNIKSKRLEKISALLNTAVKNGAELIVFPEVSIPVEWLGAVADFARRHEVLIVCGLEHIIYDNKLCCNYIATILPDKYKDYTFAAIKLRLKNHYSPKEKEWVKGYGWELPKENESWKKEYDLFRWKGIDFSTFSCFELANIKDRALFTSFVDLLIGSVHNRDVNYYSNVMESLARDVHCYFVHVNDSVFGDNRIIQPSSTNNKNILQVSGGINDVVLVGEIDIKKLREFQIKNYNLQINDKSFKPVPPEYKHNNVKIRSNLPL
ncbi:reverse transcriptase domain-containing protein [Clostridium perfringens]|uniref:Reverse transcriptase domain-containing protein n=4 Tax=Clostridium perfringens TaxID=1502 RepID=B1BP29_CLOPF|nr:reverse transcriptase domain-containing protein [Clostridium perfringens]EDT16448.1 conserved hypothetical protein [Clostridium perfringens E str. JGS1987]ELC8459567.1 hypothetical protein [Clostridium perfringens]NGT03013.1 hypothetical protein [Clostridium perfringens]